MTVRHEVSTKGWPGNLVACVEVIAAAFTRNGRKAEEAKSDAKVATVALAEYFGGRPFYIPKIDRLRALARHSEILEAVNRTGNVQQVAIDFGMTAQNVYGIINAAKIARREAQK